MQTEQARRLSPGVALRVFFMLELTEKTLKPGDLQTTSRAPAGLRKAAKAC